MENGSEIDYKILQTVAKEIIGRELTFTEAELKHTLTAEYFVSIRTIYGGSAPIETKRALEVERELEGVDKNWLVEKSKSLESATNNLKSSVDLILQKWN